MTIEEGKEYPGSGACETCGLIEPCTMCIGSYEFASIDHTKNGVSANSVNESLKIAAEQTYKFLKETAIFIKRNLDEQKS